MKQPEEFTGRFGGLHRGELASPAERPVSRQARHQTTPDRDPGLPPGWWIFALLGWGVAAWLAVIIVLLII